MNNKNSNRSSRDNLVTGMIAGLTAAWANTILQNKKYEIDDEWHFQDKFESFSGAHYWKSEGYKLKHDIDDTVIKPKFVNIFKRQDWLYEISVDNKGVNVLDTVLPEIIPELIKDNISYTFDKYLSEGMIIFNTSLIRVESVKTDNLLTIIISDIKDDSKLEQEVADSYICVNLEEADILAKEMKRYYYNYFDRVLIKNTISDMEDQGSYSLISNLIDNITSIGKYPFNEVANILKDTRYQNDYYFITLLSVTNILIYYGYLNNAEKFLELLLEVETSIIERDRILKDINDRLLDVYIKLKRHEKIKKIIDENYLDDSYKMTLIGKKLTEADLSNTAVYLYEKLAYKEKDYRFYFDLFDAYKKIKDIRSIKILRTEIHNKYPGTGLIKAINNYLGDINYRCREANGYLNRSERKGNNPMLYEFAKLLKNSNYAVVLTGAGMSTESGIPDFRSEDGLWRGTDPMKVACREAMINNYEKFYEFYKMRIKNLENCYPHIGYDILARWEKDGLIRSIITQNVDDFHIKAGNNKVLRVHGSINEFGCICCKESASKTKFMSKERCSKCGSNLRPNIVLFGEGLNEKVLNGAIKEVKKADLLIVIGTSLLVSPVNQMIKMTKGKKIYVNKDISLSQNFDLTFCQNAAGVLQAINGIIRSGC